MKIIPKIIIWLTKLEEKKISTLYGEKPKNIYCHRNEKGEVQGLLFLNEDEYPKLCKTGKITILLSENE